MQIYNMCARCVLSLQGSYKTSESTDIIQI